MIKWQVPHTAVSSPSISNLHADAVAPFPPTTGPKSPNADQHTQKSVNEYQLNLDVPEAKLSTTLLDPPNQIGEPRAFIDGKLVEI